MNKNTSMITLVLALFGCALIIGSVFSLYKSSSTNVDSFDFTKTEIDIANRKIDVLSNEIKETKEMYQTTEVSNDDGKPELFNSVTGENIPILEITDTDLGDGSDGLISDRKNGQRIVYNHQIKFSLLNVGKYSLKEVLFSVKDIYNQMNEKAAKKKRKEYKYMGKTFDNEDVGAYNTIEVNTLNLKTKRLIYVSNLPSSFGVGDYYYDLVIEWNNGLYQMHIDIEELNGKLKYRYQFFDVDGKPINFQKMEENTSV
jgi:hypothetical protein